MELGPLESPIAEAQRILEAAEESRLCLRLLGGVAYYFRCGSAASENLRRRYVDIDFVGFAKQSHSIEKLFAELGYSARERFNLMQGDKRLIFNDLSHQRRVDIFLDVFEMCHKLDLRKRLEIDKYTIPLADLLATKLQIIEVNDKDLRDMLCMLMDHPIGKDEDGEMINGSYLARLCADDWGIYRTFTQNLNKVLNVMAISGLSPAEQDRVKARIDQLKSTIEEAPKSLKWKMRARVGDKVKWYELPEMDKEVVDSRTMSADPPQSS